MNRTFLLQLILFCLLSCNGYSQDYISEPRGEIARHFQGKDTSYKITMDSTGKGLTVFVSGFEEITLTYFFGGQRCDSIIFNSNCKECDERHIQNFTAYRWRKWQKLDGQTYISKKSTGKLTVDGNSTYWVPVMLIQTSETNGVSITIYEAHLSRKEWRYKLRSALK